MRWFSLTLYVPHELLSLSYITMGGGPRVVVSTAAFHARARGSVPGFGGLEKNKKKFFPIPVWKSVLWGASVTEK